MNPNCPVNAKNRRANNSPVTSIVFCSTNLWILVARGMYIKRLGKLNLMCLGELGVRS